jgi:hypothetical protein
MVTSLPVPNTLAAEIGFRRFRSSKSARKSEKVETKWKMSPEYEEKTLVALSNGDISSCHKCHKQLKSTSHLYEQSEKNAFDLRMVHAIPKMCTEHQWEAVVAL